MSRKATLTVHRKDGSDQGWVRLTASNGEPLMHGELLHSPGRGRRAIIAAMKEIIQDLGFELVDLHEGCDYIETMCDECKANLDASDRESGLDLDDAHDANVAQRMGE